MAYSLESKLTNLNNIIWSEHLLVSFGAIVCAIVLYLISKLYKIWEKAKRVTKSFPADCSPTTEDKENLSRITKVTEQHSDHTAEVFNFSVHGRSKVLTCRLLQPGDKIELRLKDNFLKIFAFGEYLSETYLSDKSNLKMVFEQNILYHSYIGGRYNCFMSDSIFDYFTVIIFYKVDGIPPTKVNIQLNDL